SAGRASHRAFHEGYAGIPDVRLFQSRRASVDRGWRHVPFGERAGRPAGARRVAAFRELADVPAAFHPGRIDWRLRHHRRSENRRRVGAHGPRRGRSGVLMLPISRLPTDWQVSDDTLADRVVLVTGAYGGLGGAVARAASRAGATVVISGKRKRQLEQLYDAMCAEGLAEPVIHPLDMEVATPREYAALAEGLERDFGRLDG